MSLIFPVPPMPPGTLVFPLRPDVTLAGSRLTGDQLVSLRVEVDAEVAMCDIVVANWGVVQGAPGFIHPDGGAALLGQEMGVFLADGKSVFKGVIERVEALFPEGAPPSIRLQGEALQAPLLVPSRGRRRVLPVHRWGGALLAFSGQAERGEQGPLHLGGHGTLVGLHVLRPGDALGLQGLGAAFSGSYRLQRVRYRFDGENGAHTDFEGLRFASLPA